MFLDEVTTELSNGNKVELRKFGIFEVKRRAARTGRNPKTGEKVYVPEKKVVKFRVGKVMQESVNGENR